MLDGVNPGIAFGLRGAGSFRMCFAQDERTWPEVLDRMAETLATMSRGSVSRPLSRH